MTVVEDREGDRMRTTLMGLPVDILSFGETLALAEEAMRSGVRRQHVALNVAKLVNARREPELDRDIRNSDIVGIDGMGIVWALRVLGERRAERVPGIDLFERLVGRCAATGFRPYLLGATAEIAAAAEAELKRRHPGLDVAGRHHGYFTAEEEEGICAQIAESGAHCLFVAMPTPRKERFMLRNRDRLAVPFVMGVGGSFDVVAGKVQRAPGLVQRMGLEWAFRLAQEPRRLAARYAHTNAVFAWLLAKEIGQRLTARSLKAITPGKVG
jgi:N-acetylglucosaminyldiphosphoundecaprenol N-acetyl-beta-D-mannosaminyltransferase